MAWSAPSGGGCQAQGSGLKLLRARTFKGQLNSRCAYGSGFYGLLG